MKSYILVLSFIFSSFLGYSQNFQKCEGLLDPSICVGKILSRKLNRIEASLPRPRLLSGIYFYTKGPEKTPIGKRKIIVEGSLVKYFGSNGSVFTHFQCLPGKTICYSNDRHTLIIMGENEFFIDWADDSNGHYKPVIIK